MNPVLPRPHFPKSVWVTSRNTCCEQISSAVPPKLDLTKKQPLRKVPVDVNEAIQEVTVLTHGEEDNKISKCRCSLLAQNLDNAIGRTYPARVKP
jgi:hypothetical protein